MPNLFSQKSDKELWDLLRKNNKEAFSILYKRHIEALFNFGLKLTSNQEIIKDTLQELFTEFWKKRNGLSEVTHVKVYLMKSFRYKLLRGITQLNRVRTYSFEELLLNIPDLEVSDTEASLERKRALKEQLEQLSKRQREVIHLRYFQNLKIEEIGQILNINYQSVSNILHRAVKKLKKHFIGNLKLP